MEARETFFWKVRVNFKKKDIEGKAVSTRQLYVHGYWKEITFSYITEKKRFPVLTDQGASFVF